MAKLEISEPSVTHGEVDLKKECENLVATNRAINREKIMLDNALHLYSICYASDRALEVMRNCVRIAMHELGDDFNLEVIRGCNQFDITISDYVDSQAKYLLKAYYNLIF
jgi:hypothetical protein